MKYLAIALATAVLGFATPAFADIADPEPTNNGTTGSTNNDTTATNNGTTSSNNGTSGDGHSDEEDHAEDDGGCSTVGGVGTFAPMLVGIGLLVATRRRRD